MKRQIESYPVFLVTACFEELSFEIRKEVEALNEWEAAIKFDKSMNYDLDKYYDQDDYSIKAIVMVEK